MLMCQWIGDPLSPSALVHKGLSMVRNLRQGSHHAAIRAREWYDRLRAAAGFARLLRCRSLHRQMRAH
jgi:hypothetical protein